MARGLLVSVLLLAACIPSAYSGSTWGSPTPEQPTQIGAVITNAAIADRTLPILVYGGGVRIVRGDRDDAPRWVSGGLPSTIAAADIQPFEGTHEDWRTIMGCAQAHVAGLPVSLVDQQPISGDYLLVTVGGNAAAAGQADVWGFASTGDRAVVERGVGFVFSADVIDAERNGLICEALAHEIGHLLGLVHVAECNDVMSDNRTCPRVVPRAGFLGETRAILARSLAAWGAVQGAESPQVATLVPTLDPITDVETSGWLRVWPMAIATTSSISQAIVRYTTPAGLRGEYHMNVDGHRASGRMPLDSRGQWTIVIEVHHTDGTIGRTVEYIGSIY